MAKRGLGRGLDALLPSAASPADVTGVREIPLRDISPNKFQPRQRFDEMKLAELADSIKEHGVVQPVIVRRVEGGYELIIGERRWRAAQAAGLRAIPAVVKEMGSEEDVMTVALVENLQREDLNPLEEASAFHYLIQEFGLTQEEVSQRVGRSRSQVANTLRLLNLDPEIQEQVQAGNLSMGHAKVLLSMSDGSAQKRLFRLVIDKGLSVREAEEAARRQTAVVRPGNPQQAPENPFSAVEEEMRNALGTRVRVVGRPHRGRVEIDYYSGEELDRLVSILTRLRPGG